MTQHSNQKSKTPQGKPSGSARGGNGIKDVTNQNKASKAVEDNYLDKQGELSANVNLKHKNRNTDKGRENQGKDTVAM